MVDFQIWDFLAPQPVPVPFWNVCSGEGGVFRRRRKHSPVRLCPPSSLLSSDTGLGMVWADGRGKEGNINSEVREDGESRVAPSMRGGVYLLILCL